MAQWARPEHTGMHCSAPGSAVEFFGKDTERPPSAHSCWAVKVFPYIQPLSISAPVLPGRTLPIYSRTFYSCEYIHCVFDPVQLGASQCCQPDTWMSLCFPGYTSLEWVLTDCSVHFGDMTWKSFLAYRGYAISLFCPLNTGRVTYISVEKKKTHKNYLSSSLRSLCCVPIHSLCVPVTFSYYLRKKIICPVKSSVAPLIRSNYVQK